MKKKWRTTNGKMGVPKRNRYEEDVLTEREQCLDIVRLRDEDFYEGVFFRAILSMEFDNVSLES